MNRLLVVTVVLAIAACVAADFHHHHHGHHHHGHHHGPHHHHHGHHHHHHGPNANSSSGAKSYGVPLYDYVSAPDSHYSWFDTGFRLNQSGLGWTGYLLNMTSQKWLTDADCDRTVWTHQLLVIVPDNIKDVQNSAIYVTGNGNNNPKNPEVLDEDVLVGAVLGIETGTVTAVLWQIPNQPIVFSADPKKSARGEDALVAFTWYQFVNNPDRPEWVAYLPMVKAVVRAMDTVQAFTSQLDASLKIDKFLIAGASKRGATTWLTGAYAGGVGDTRVSGIVPIVFDMLNFTNNVPHMYQAYGGWTFAFTDYYNMNITQFIGTPKMTLLASVIDPLNYADALTMPKLVVDSPGDEFFMPDDDYFWWGQLPGETYRLHVQNAEHTMATGVFELVASAQGFYQSIISQSTRPFLNWTIDETTGDLTMWTDTKPTQVLLQYAETIASSPNRRDFRLIKGDTKADPCTGIVVHVFGNACFNPVLWGNTAVQPSYEQDGYYYYTAHIDAPANGNWVGFFFEATYPGPSTSDFTFTTQISIVPRTYPFPPCGTGADCIGQLV